MSQELILYTQDAPQLDADRFAGWQLIARGKQKMDGLLQGHELALQSMFVGAEQMDRQTLADTLAAYRKEHSALIEDRKAFTSILDFVKESCMATEKKYAPAAYEPYKKAEARELDLRRQENEIAQRTLNIEQEKGKLRAFLINQYASIGMDYRNKLQRYILQGYTSCLNTGATGEAVEGTKKYILQCMYELQPMSMGRFELVYLTTEQAQEIYATVPAVDLRRVYDECIQFMNEKFAMYESDLHNAQAAIEQARQEQAAAENQAAADLAQQSAVNELVQTSTVYVAPAAEVKAVTEIIPDDSIQFVVTVVSAFLAHVQKCMPKIRAKDYSKINIGQMAKALIAAGVEVPGLNLKTVEK